jgi:hypothetical protein
LKDLSIDEGIILKCILEVYIAKSLNRIELAWDRVQRCCGNSNEQLLSIIIIYSTNTQKLIDLGTVHGGNNTSQSLHQKTYIVFDQLLPSVGLLRVIAKQKIMGIIS